MAKDVYTKEATRRLAQAVPHLGKGVGRGYVVTGSFETADALCFGSLARDGTFAVIAMDDDGIPCFHHGLWPASQAHDRADFRPVYEARAPKDAPGVFAKVVAALGLHDFGEGYVSVIPDPGFEIPGLDVFKAIVGAMDWGIVRVVSDDPHQTRGDNDRYRGVEAEMRWLEPKGKALTDMLVGLPLELGMAVRFDLDRGLNLDLPIGENALRLAEAIRGAPLPRKDREWLLGATRCLDTLEGGVEFDVQSHLIPRFLAENPPRAKVPTDAPAWQALFDLMKVAQLIERYTKTARPALREVPGNRFVEFRDKVLAGHLRNEPGRIPTAFAVGAANHLAFPIHSYARHVVRPMAERAGFGSLYAGKEAHAFAYRDLVGDKGMGGLRDLSDDLHARWPAVSQALGKAVAGLGLSWEPAFPGEFQVDLITTARCLTTPEELAAEGHPRTGLDHCVAGYYLACIQDGTVIVSLRRHGRPFETMRFDHTTDRTASGEPGGWSLVEHSGRRNAPPAPGGWDRSAIVCNHLRTHRPKGMPSGTLLANLTASGFDPMRPKAIMDVTLAYLPILPRGLRAAGPQGILDRLKADAQRLRRAA